MTKIKMTKSRRGASNGFTIRNYEQGKTYDVSESLANSFVKMNVCTKVGAIEAVLKSPVKEKKISTPVTSVKKA